MPARQEAPGEARSATLSRAGATATVPSGDGLRALFDRAQTGDVSAVPELRKLFVDRDAVDVLGGNLARDVCDKLVEKYAGKNLMVREALVRKMELLRADLAGSDASPLECLLADRIVSCWLFLHHLEALYVLKDSMSLALGDYYLRNIHRAQKSYVSAVKALATVRKLAIPALQVNIAKKQVNLVGASPPRVNP
jgi:hypothetical protein